MKTTGAFIHSGDDFVDAGKKSVQAATQSSTSKHMVDKATSPSS
jgi:hypothetical protein